ncbi:hypothetical protein [Rhodococcus tukisamuensis]|uniref:Uncharacterized protein n=1 Tax=Rhodococcus tukisamuensis TaxID=168276 RepID=A0A1G6TAD3_9NOCA|nr:hypothetical protein [Rhodococcus tukisamuensis]SDD25285.1 hypothetical protein SAMN05444580_103434 [Rhodococcus tukisamuensis]
MSAHDHCADTFNDKATDASRRVRLARRVASTNLLMLGLGATAIGVSILADQWPVGWIQILAVPAVFLILWGIVYVRAQAMGVRRRGVGYHLIALIAVLSIFFGLLPLVYIVGALSLLGVGFFVIGWRERCWPVWATALAAIVVGLVTVSEPARQLLWTERSVMSYVSAGVATLVFAVIALAGAAQSRIVENQGLRVG